VIKSLKPLKTYTLAVQSSDTIADIKSHLASQPGAPPVDVQRLLLKGKALADAKLLKEYNIKDGDTVNLMVKPGYDWNQAPKLPTVEIPVPEPEPPAPEPPSATLEPGTTRPDRHRRVPSVILSPSPNTLTPLREGPPIDVALSLDDGDILPPAQAPPTPYQNVVSSPNFWSGLLDFLRSATTSSRFRVFDHPLAHVSNHGRTSRMHSRSSLGRARAHLRRTRSPRFGTTLVSREWQGFRESELAICIRNIWVSIVKPLPLHLGMEIICMQIDVPQPKSGTAGFFAISLVMTISSSLPLYPSKNAQISLPRSQLSTLNQKIALGLAQVLDLPHQKRDDQSCREFVASYAQDMALQILEALIWGRNDDLDPDKWTKDEKLIRQRTLLLAERLAATKASNSASLDLQTLLDLSIVFYPTHPSRVRSLFSTALASTPFLKIAVEMETVPAFTQYFSPSGGATNTGLYGLRKAAHCLKSFVLPSPPEFIRLFALNEQFLVALAGAYDHGLSSLAPSYGLTGLEDGPNTQDQKIFVETKVALMDAFHTMVKSGMVASVVSGERNGDIQKVLGVLLALADLPTAAVPQFPSNATSAELVPFLNRTLLEDYHDAYDFTKTLTAALRKLEQDDARIDLFEAQLRPTRSVGGNERRPGVLKILLHSSGAPLPRVDHKGKGRADPDRVDTPPPVNPSDDLDVKITQVLDVLPGTPPDYIRALLQHPNDSFKGNPERVIEALLEGTAPPMEDLQQPTAGHPPQPEGPAQEQFVYTQGRRNIFDDQEMDPAHVRIGKR